MGTRGRQRHGTSYGYEGGPTPEFCCLVVMYSIAPVCKCGGSLLGSCPSHEPRATAARPGGRGGLTLPLLARSYVPYMAWRVAQERSSTAVVVSTSGLLHSCNREDKLLTWNWAKFEVAILHNWLLCTVSDQLNLCCIHPYCEPCPPRLVGYAWHGAHAKCRPLKPSTVSGMGHVYPASPAMC